MEIYKHLNRKYKFLSSVGLSTDIYHRLVQEFFHLGFKTLYDKHFYSDGSFSYHKDIIFTLNNNIELSLCNSYQYISKANGGN